MELVKTGNYMGKAVEVFKEYDWKYHYFVYTVKIDNEYLHSINSGKKSENPSTYATENRAFGAAKSSIKKNMNKVDEIANIEREIERLQARLKELRN